MEYAPIVNANLGVASLTVDNTSTYVQLNPTVSFNHVEAWWNKLLDIIGSSVFQTPGKKVTSVFLVIVSVLLTLYPNQPKSGDDPDVLYVWFLTAYSYAFFWFFGMLFVAMDLTGRPQCLRKYKIQPGKNEPLPWPRFKQLVLTVLRNQFIFGIPTGYLVFHSRKMFTAEIPPVRLLPSLCTIAQDMAVCILCWEIGYYYTHRLLHSRLLYRRFHKQHHEWNAPVALAAMYSHPVEFVVSDLLPVYAGPAIMRSHVFTVLIWLSYVMIDTLADHSDYHLPFLASSEFHDYHHLNFTQCFGNFGLWDLLHGTAKEFLRKKQFQRHHRLFSFKSAREWIPDKET